MMKSKYLVAAFSLVLLTGRVFAQNGSNQSSTSLGVDTVVVASDESHLDSTISDLPADTIGMPVVLTNSADYETTATLIVDGDTIRETIENITITSKPIFPLFPLPSYDHQFYKITKYFLSTPVK